jgi:hypothetical protein
MYDGRDAPVAFYARGEEKHRAKTFAWRDSGCATPRVQRGDCKRLITEVKGLTTGKLGSDENPYTALNVSMRGAFQPSHNTPNDPILTGGFFPKVLVVVEILCPIVQFPYLVQEKTYATNRPQYPLSNPDGLTGLFFIRPPPRPLTVQRHPKEQEGYAHGHDWTAFAGQHESGQRPLAFPNFRTEHRGWQNTASTVQCKVWPSIGEKSPALTMSAMSSAP